MLRKLAYTTFIIVSLIFVTLAIQYTNVSKDRLPTHNNDIPELYSQLNWGNEKSVVLALPAAPGGALVNTSSYTSDYIDTYPHDIINYYTRELDHRNWELLTHNKGSSTGESYLYDKLEDNLLVNIQRTFSGKPIRNNFFIIEITYPDGDVYKGYLVTIRYSLAE